MRILLIAYEFPPIVSAQSLRWFYLANELARLGVEVHVLCPDMPALPPFHQDFAPGVIIHRVWPGPYVGFSQSAYLYISRRSQGAGVVGPIGGDSIWLKMHRWGRRALDQIIFPDLRTEWVPTASLRLIHLLRTTKFSAIVASHEPGADLLLGLLAKRIFRIPLIIDLADPVVAPYTPRWRQRIDLAFEAKIITHADAMVVTTTAVVDLLRKRHDLHDVDGKFTCIAQGFPSKNSEFIENRDRSKSLRLVYTGNFYADFRSPAELAIALRSLRDLDISVEFYGNHVAYQSLFDGIPGIKFHGVADHGKCIWAQQNCNVLLSIGNSQPFQIPGKIYEYLGAGTPILHISSAATDEAGALIMRVCAGWVIQNNAASIERTLREIHACWLGGALESMFLRNESAIAEFAWSKRAIHYKEVIHRILETSKNTGLADDSEQKKKKEM
ncbi:glycosyltransferase [Acidovorax sp. sif1233]|uniref:glycosyltransferase n=1 Tax=unclassified Acidovorax TaxID=2684926 RepID=UPI001C481EAA|nr:MULTISPECIES: glycosyltransferase [unclassified Acidovorax]MBV7429982.1 glycosyltransferase [Acidovorax sp. sif0732]MBV7451375.1 glycosyltransferase [Acidovorax sp. sif0715]MBV7454457.1 glycosyltransferase [Acidovorax sp. sif1233]